MDDKELLGLLAGEAPEPRTDLAEAVVRSGRRVRTRRRMAVLGGSAAFVAVVGFLAPGIVNGTSGSDAQPANFSAAEKAPVVEDHALLNDQANDQRLEGATGEATSGSSAKAPNAGAMLSKTRPDLDLYVAVLETIPGDLMIADGTEHGLSPEFRRLLTERLPGRKFTFPSHAEKKALTDAVNPTVTLGEVKVDGTSAEVWVARGDRPLAPVRLTKRDGRWTVDP
ncbi:hypothetical protein GCM10027589_32220 [Actinocorallia lasiicapitis]